MKQKSAKTAGASRLISKSDPEGCVALILLGFRFLSQSL